MDHHALFDELVKLGAVGHGEAQRALDRVETLEQNKPTLKQVGRYAGLGAVTAPVVGAVTNAIKGDPLMGTGVGFKSKARNLLGQAVGGAVGMGAMPLIRDQLDRKAEIGTLKKYVHQHEAKKP